MSYLSSVFGLGKTFGSVISGLLSTIIPIPVIFLVLAVFNTGALPIINAIDSEKREG
jgi:hypothetical protein